MIPDEQGAPTKRLTRQQSINAFCKDCIYDPFDHGAGTWREQVEACPSTECPLWPYRPKSRKARTESSPEQTGSDTSAASEDLTD